MIRHSLISVLFVVTDEDSHLRPFLSYLQSLQHVQITVTPDLPRDLSPYHVVVTADTSAFVDTDDVLGQFVRAGGGWLGLIHRSDKDKPLPDIFGAQPDPVGPSAELRVLFHNRNHVIAARLPDAFYLKGRYRALNQTADDTELILYADWHYGHRPVLVHRPVGNGQVACTTLQDFGHCSLQQILYRLIRRLSGRTTTDRKLGIGLLGYAPSVGQTHGMGVQSTPGLELRAACDLNSEQLNRALQDFPDVRTYTSPQKLADDPDIDLVIIATPPNTHAALSLQMMDAGKHVVCEKPLAFNRKETASMAEMAEKQQLHLSCHQNRRWDVDYLAIKQALAEGLIGDLFYMETFVGGFNHPCGYWHSHEMVSGGTAYDWGGHYLDWTVSLIPERVAAVIGTRHNRVWHDVTNADQERIQIRFTGGQEADFIHSDIAAVRKPKWYLLGTEGAIIGLWRDVIVYESDPLLYFHQNDIPATEMPPALTLHRRHRSGQIIAQKLPIPRREHYRFHRNLADHLITGEPIAAPLEDSMRVVAILEAAATSSANGGRVEVLDD